MSLTDTFIPFSNCCNGVQQSILFNTTQLYKRLFNKTSEFSSNFFMKYPESVHRKLESMINQGPDDLQIISDFDWTLSKFCHNGELNPTCHGIFENDPDVTAEAQNKLRNLRLHYSPIETDPNIPNLIKIPMMEEWWGLANNVIVDSNIHKDALQATVNSSNLRLRGKVLDFLAFLHELKIPTLVFSAGLGNIIELVLNRFNVLSDNVKVISNFMEFNEEGLLVGFKLPIIHTFNKTIASVASTDYLKKTLSKRRSIILLGDSLHDPHMADGLIDEEAAPGCAENNTSAPQILKIGFLNSRVESLLDVYMEIYDIVLINDASFELPCDILSCIANGGAMKSE